MTVSLFTTVPVELYRLCVTLQGTFASGLTPVSYTHLDVYKRQVLAVLSVVLFFLTQPLVWRFRFVDWWTVLFVLLCGTALAMLIWRRRSESATEEDTAEG